MFEKKTEINEQDLLVNQFNIDLVKNLDSLLNGNSDDLDVVNLNQSEIQALAVMRSLPQDPTARLVFFEEFKKHADSRFSDSSLVALEAFFSHAKDLRLKLKKDWRNFMSYPQYLDQEIEEKLDEIAMLIDVSDGDDRYVCLADFLQKALDNGLITKKMHGDIRSAIGPHM